MQPPASPVKQRLRTTRRRVTVAVLATFVAAWVAVAALGKGGATSSTATTTPSSTGSSTSTQSDDGSASSTQSSSGSSGSGSSSDGGSSSQSTRGAPVTTSQS
jgi:hypothetical protein